MYTTSLSAILSGALAVLVLLRVVISYVVQYRKLSHVPGPFLSGVSRWFFIKSTAKNTLHLDCATLCQKHGMLDHSPSIQGLADL